MDDLQKHVKTVLDELQYVQIKDKWRKHLIACGIDEKDANKWVAEIGHIVDEYERSLRYLMEYFDDDKPEVIAKKLYHWIAYVKDISVFIIEDVYKGLDGAFDKYLPDEPEDDEDDMS